MASTRPLNACVILNFRHKSSLMSEINTETQNAQNCVSRDEMFDLYI